MVTLRCNFLTLCPFLVFRYEFQGRKHDQNAEISER